MREWEEEPRAKGLLVHPVILAGVFGAPGSPWVEAKENGYGFHGSADGYRQFTQTRVMTTTAADASEP